MLAAALARIRPTGSDANPAPTATGPRPTGGAAVGIIHTVVA